MSATASRPDSRDVGGDRPDVLAYPSPATARYLVLVAALLTAGLFVGNWFYTQIHGDAWVRTLVTCARPTGGGATATELLSAQAAAATCQADVERTRTLYALGGGLAAAAIAITVMFAAPAVVRRRRKLRPLGPHLAGATDRFAVLASEAEVSARVTPLIGASTLRDAFSFGAPGRYAVALPPALAVRWRDPALFDPLVRHELAHARHRDIALAWLTRSVWYAVLPLLLAPVALSVLTGDLSILPSYVWRAVLLGGVFALLSAALLRAREHSADLRAARWQGDVEVMAGVVGSARPVPGHGPRALVARHPTPDERVGVLHEPSLLVRLEVWDGLIGAFLAGLAGPLIVSAISPALAASGRSMQSYVVAAVVVGPLVGASVGLAVWRSAFVARVRGETAGVLSVAIGAGLGLSLGLGVSLGRAGVPGISGISDPWGLLVPGLACAGATVLSAGLAHLWADLAPRLPGAGACRLLTVAVNAVLYATVFWAGYVLQAMVETGGWRVGRITLVDMLTSWPVFAVEVLLAATAATALALRAPATTRSWQLEGGLASWRAVPRPRLLLVLGLGAAGGLAATSVVVVYRLVHGEAASNAAAWDRFEGNQWAIAVAAAVVSVVLIVRDPHRGGGSALLAAPVAATTGVLGYLALNTALGGNLEADFVWQTWRPAMVLACYLTWAVAIAAYAVGRVVHLPREIGRAGTAGILVATLVLAAGGATVALTQRQHLVGYNPFGSVDAELAHAGLDTLGGGPAAAVTYHDEVMLPLSDDYETLRVRALQIDADTGLSPDERASRMETEVAQQVRDLREQWTDPATDDPALLAAHAEALAALDAAAQRYHWAAVGYVATDQASADAARTEVLRLGAEESQHWSRWISEVSALLSP